jgi:MurNAc alpha-1-phosphate uridylyltransferase
MLDRLADQGVEAAVVNVHYLADQIKAHTANRTKPKVTISDESGQILGTGGGVVKALPLLGDAPFFHVNADSIWIEGPKPNLDRMAGAFDAARMDVLLLMAATATSIGYDGLGDYAMLSDGSLQRRKERLVAPFVYAGVAVLSPKLFMSSRPS